MDKCALIAVILLATASSIHKETEAAVRRDCTADALRHCLVAIPHGRSAILHCMLDKRALLSQACKAHLH